MSEVDEIIKKILANKGVIGVIILNNDGIPIRSTLDHQTTVQYAGNIHDVTRKGRSCIKDLDQNNDLCLLRLRSNKHEIMIAPDKDYTMIVVQNPSEL